MKRFLLTLCTVVLLVTSTVVLISCGHTQVYEKLTASDKYMKSEATCTDIGVYYYSCTVCGKKGTSTFKYGEPKGHVFANDLCTVCGSWRYSEGLEFASNGDGTCVVSGIGNCKEAEVLIPPTSPDGHTVTGIGDKAFANCIDIASVVIPEGVLTIGESAFLNCTGLKSVVIPDGFLSIGRTAFMNCTGIASITLPESLTDIGIYAFNNCYKLVEVINKSSLDIVAGNLGLGNVGYYAKEVHSGDSKIVNVDDYIFYACDGVNYLLGYTGDDVMLVLPDDYNGESYEIYCYAFHRFYNLTSVTIPAGVVNIGDYAFEYCYKLVEVINKSQLEIYAIWPSHASNGHVARYAKEVHNGKSKIVAIDGYLFYTFDGVNYLVNYTGKDSALTLPKNYNGEEYEIGMGAFYSNANLRSIVISDSVTAIDSLAFENCSNLAEVTMGKGVTSIGSSAFKDCVSITGITIPASVTSIGKSAFLGCSSLSTAAFETKSGWWRWESLNSPEWTKKSIHESSLDDKSTAAEYLTFGYKDYFWERK